MVNGTFIKDIRILKNYDMKDIVLVDNAVYSFAYQLDNGIPIIAWYDNQNDKELQNLMGYFQHLAKCEDIRTINR